MKKVLVACLLILLVCGCGKNKEEDKKQEEKKEQIPVAEEKVKVIDLDSKARPYAVVINNYPGAVKVQRGLADAYMIYEIPVEGGMSRSLALYKDKTTAKIGTVRSARHNFLDYVLENDAIFVHWGYSHYAKDQIKQFKIDSINGLSDKPFWRENPEKLASEHTGYTGLDKVIAYAKEKGYRQISDATPVLKYTVEKVDVSNKEGSIKANTILIPYSNIYSVKFEYDFETGLYKRYVNNKAHTDYGTKAQYTAKNIIVTKISYKNASDNYYLDIHNIGTGKGYYITNGEAVPITWEKKDRKSKTIYKYNDGSPLEVNDGNTYIMLQSVSQKLTIKE